VLTLDCWNRKKTSDRFTAVDRRLTEEPVTEEPERDLLKNLRETSWRTWGRLTEEPERDLLKNLRETYWRTWRLTEEPERDLRRNLRETYWKTWETYWRTWERLTEEPERDLLKNLRVLLKNLRETYGGTWERLTVVDCILEQLELVSRQCQLSTIGVFLLQVLT